MHWDELEILIKKIGKIGDQEKINCILIKNKLS